MRFPERRKFPQDFYTNLGCYSEDWRMLVHRKLYLWWERYCGRVRIFCEQHFLESNEQNNMPWQERRITKTMKTRSGRVPTFRNPREFVFEEEMLVKIVAGDHIWKRGRVVEVKKRSLLVNLFGEMVLVRKTSAEECFTWREYVGKQVINYHPNYRYIP
jgi:hypothetical protein